MSWEGAQINVGQLEQETIGHPSSIAVVGSQSFHLLHEESEDQYFYIAILWQSSNLCQETLNHDPSVPDCGLPPDTKAETSLFIYALKACSIKLHGQILSV